MSFCAAGAWYSRRRVLNAPQFLPTLASVTAVLIWGTSDFLGGLASRRANAFVLTAFCHFCALALMTAIAFEQHRPFLDRSAILWALAGGALGGFALAVFYGALASGQMGLIAPVAALLGAAIPTLADVALEGAPKPWTFVGFALAIIALWLITRREETEPEDRVSSSGDVSSETPSSPSSGFLAAALAGTGFAGFYLCAHQASGSPVWIAGISRIGSLAATTAAIAVTRVPLKLSRPAALLGVLAGFLDISGSALFIYASQHGRLDQAVVITSLYPAVTVILARMVLKEHFTRWKLIGLLSALAAVPIIASG
jgi:drug/metabolite transporter (DMT)-like permease